MRDARQDGGGGWGESWVRVCFQLKSSLSPAELWGMNGMAKLSLPEASRLSCYTPNSVNHGLNNGPRCAPARPGFFHKAAPNQGPSPREGPRGELLAAKAAATGEDPAAWAPTALTTGSL